VVPITSPESVVAPSEVLSLVVARRRVLADGVLGVRLEMPGGADLPVWEPGAHVELLLPSGLVRQYSLCGDPVRRSRYEIAVLRVDDGRGGSREVHDVLAEGATVDVRGPRNHFRLAVEAPHHLLLAGGIGVTPIVAMARQLARDGADWSVVYGGRELGAMALREELEGIDPARVRVLPQDVHGIVDLVEVLGAAPPGTVAYVCGPAPMIDAAVAAAARVDLLAELRYERFGGAGSNTAVAAAADGSFELELRASGRTVVVEAGETVLEAVEKVAPDWPFSCREGYCGTCEVKVLEGDPDHRDDVLTDDEKAAGASMMPCVSRSLTPRLVLDA
jgi:ferredoxin-NADP reductase